MDHLKLRYEAAERLVQHAEERGVNLTPFRDENNVFLGRMQRRIDFWLKDGAFGYHLNGAIETLPAQLSGSNSSFRGVWDEAGSVADVDSAFNLLQAWVIDLEEVDDLPERKVHRAMI